MDFLFCLLMVLVSWVCVIYAGVKHERARRLEEDNRSLVRAYKIHSALTKELGRAKEKLEYWRGQSLN